MIQKQITLDRLPAAAEAQRRAISDPAALRKPLKIVEQLMISAAKGNIANGTDPLGRPFAPLKFPRAAGGDKPLRDTGLLLASISARSTERDVVVGTNRPGASLHQAGGVITPKRAKFLTIPKTREAARVRPRQFPRELRAIIGKSGRGGVLVDPGGTVQYVLTRGPVTVPARPFLGFSEKLLLKIDRVFEQWLGTLLATDRPPS